MISPSVRRLDATGEPCYGHGKSDFLTGTDAVVVLCFLALRLNVGRWFLDTDAGVAWTRTDGQQQILGQHPADVAFARSEIVRVLSAVEGLDSVESVVVSLDSSRRRLDGWVRIRTIFGDSPTLSLQGVQ
jgi:hypothetical protein